MDKRCDLQIHHCFLNDRPIACSWYIKNWKNPRSWSFYFLFKIFQTRDIIHLETRGSAHWACIAHLTIEWYWSKFQREIIITLKNSSHLEGRVGLSDTILKGAHPGTIYSKFGSIWPSCFRGEDFFNISQSEKRINLGGHVCRPNGTKWRNFIEDLI